MAERIKLAEGVYMEPDDGPRDSPFHKRIVSVRPIPNTRSGHEVVLECGHCFMTFGDLCHADGVILCDVCRRAAK